MAAMPVVFTVGKKLHNLAGLYNEIAHMIHKTTLGSGRQHWLRCENKNIPVGFFMRGAAGPRPIKPYFSFRVNLMHILLNTLQHSLFCHIPIFIIIVAKIR